MGSGTREGRTSPPENEEGGGKKSVKVQKSGRTPPNRWLAFRLFVVWKRFQNTDWAVLFLEEVGPSLGWMAMCILLGFQPSIQLVNQGKIPWWVVELGFYLAGPDVEHSDNFWWTESLQSRRLLPSEPLDLFQLGPDPSCGYRYCLFFFFF